MIDERWCVVSMETTTDSEEEPTALGPLFDRAIASMGRWTKPLRGRSSVELTVGA